MSKERNIEVKCKPLVGDGPIIKPALHRKKKEPTVISDIAELSRLKKMLEEDDYPSKNKPIETAVNNKLAADINIDEIKKNLKALESQEPELLLPEGLVAIKYNPEATIATREERTKEEIMKSIKEKDKLIDELAQKAAPKMERINKAIADEEEAHKPSLPKRDNNKSVIEDFDFNKNIDSYNFGKSNYHDTKITPWDVWSDWNLNPWDADIVKRIKRSKPEIGMTMAEARILDYQKIIHDALKMIELVKEGKYFTE